MDTYTNTMNGNADMRDVVQKVGDAIDAVKNINAADVVAKAMSLSRVSCDVSRNALGISYTQI